jgi:hypothetical protein
MISADINNEITEYLSVLKHLVETRSKLNLQDINVHSEQFFKKLLNMVYDYDLVNINIDKQNVETIDLGDTKNRIAIQVTANDKKKKIIDTIDAYEKYGFYNEYDKLLVIVIKDKTPRKDIISKSDFSFDMHTDVIDVNTIIRKIMSIDSIQKLTDIRNLLYDELVSKYYKSKPTKPSEITTFLNLIEILSDESNHQTFSSESDPDPEYKIENRFEGYASYLKSQYVELSIDYQYALNLTESNGDITSVQIRKIGNYLKDSSDKILTKSQNDPKEALEQLCNFFKDILEQENKMFDERAIKFYLLHQLIKCNVFPN